MADETQTDESPKETPKEPELALVGQDRAEIYKYLEEKAAETADPTETVQADPTASEKEETKAYKSDASPKVEATAPPAAKGEVSAPPPAVGELKPEDKKDNRTVPLDALHVEREKRKAATAQIETLKRDIEALKAAQAAKPKEQTQEQITDYDETLRQMKQELANAKEEITRLSQGYQQREISDYNQRLESDISRTDRELAEAGYPGFKKFQPQVQRELLDLVMEDPENAPTVKKLFDNPDGWKKLYIENVFPEYRGVFAQQVKEETMEKKIDAKKKAALVGSPGRIDSPQKEKDEWTAQDYLAERSRRRIS